MHRPTILGLRRLGTSAFLWGALAAPLHADQVRKQDWVGVWEQGEKRIVITAPNDGAADAIVVRAYPLGAKPQSGGKNAPVVTLQGFDTDPGRPLDTDGREDGDHRIRMRLDAQQLQIQQDRSADAQAHDLSGTYRRNSHPLALLWAERPAWLQFHCDCDAERIRQSVLQQLSSGYAVGRDVSEPDNPHLVMDTVDSSAPTVLVITHSHDGACASDSFRIVSMGRDGHWRGEVARWLGLTPQAGGIQDRLLWQLTAREKQQLNGLESGDASVVPRFWWDHEQRTLKVGMETCIVLPEDASPKANTNARQLEAIAAGFKPKFYRLAQAAKAR